MGLALAVLAGAGARAEEAVKTVYAFKLNDIDGKPVGLDTYNGKVLLVVNVASKCGFTGQYEGLEKLYAATKDKGLIVLGFPSNDFMGQEPGSEAEIKQFCTSRYNVTFPMFSKIKVKGEGKAPLYKFLTEEQSADLNGEVSWNFNKFLIGRDGKVVARFGSKTKPDDADLRAAIDRALAAPAP
jgi:glutathione peroxidase